MRLLKYSSFCLPFPSNKGAGIILKSARHGFLTVFAGRLVVGCFEELEEKFFL